MRAIQATLLTLLYVGSIAGAVYEMTKHDWVVLAVFAFFALSITVGFWLFTYERLGHK